MRYLYVLCCIFFALNLSSQTPPYINYQGVARSATGEAFANKTIRLKFDIHQGSSSGAVVFTENQSVSTGNLGVFSVRIGTTTTEGVGIVNWSAGNFFLEVSIDTANTQNFTSLGSQQIISVPYAMQAASVPSTYSNNILSIGNTTMAIEQQSLSLSAPNTLSISNGNTVALAPTLNYTNNVLTVGPAGNTVNIQSQAANTFTGTGAAAVTSTGTAYEINVPVTTITESTNVNVTGTYPDFTVSATPTLSLLGPNTLSISGGNTVGLAPTIAINVNSLSVGSPSNYVLVPTPTLTGTGAASVNPPVGLNYVIHVPQTNLTPTGGGISIVNAGVNQFTLTVQSPTLSNGTNVNVTGSHPNFVINATPTLNLLSPNTLSISGGNTVAIAPSLSYANNVLTVGPSTNVVTIPPSSTSFTSSGIASVTPSSGSNFTVHVPNPVLSTNGQSIAINQGTANSSVLIPSPTLAISNNTLTVGTNTVPLETYTVSGPFLTMTSGPNHTISMSIGSQTHLAVGAVSVTPSSGSVVTITVPETTITSTSGIANVSSAGTNSFNVSVPAPSITASGNVITVTQGTATSSTILQPPTLIKLGANNNSLTAGANTIALNTYTVNGPGLQMNGTGPDYTITSTHTNPTINGTGAASVSPTTGTLFNVHVPQSTVTASYGIATITTAGTNTFDVHVPANSYNATTGVLSQGTASQNITPSVTINANTLTVGPSSNSVVIPNSALTSSGIAVVTTSANSHTVHVPATTITGTNNVTVSGGPTNYTINVPTQTLTGTGMAVVTPTTGNNFVVDVAPGYTATTGVLGGGTHTVNITPPLVYSNNILTSGPSSNSVDISGVSPWTQSATAVVLSSSSSNVGIGTSAPVENLQVESSAAHASISIISSSPHLSSLMFGTPSSHGRGRIVYDNGANSMDIFQNNTSRLHIDANGNIGLKTTAASPYDFSIYNPGTATSIRLFNSTTVGGGFLIGHNNFGASIINYDNTSMQLGTNGNARITIAGGGNVGIGTTAPQELLTVESSASSAQLSIVSPSPQLSVLSFGYQGNHALGKIQYNSTSNMMAFGTSGQNGQMVIDGFGKVGIGSTSPQENLQVENASGNAQVSIISPSPQVSSLNFGNPASHNQGQISYANTGDNMQFKTSGTDRMVITGIGRVGIGNTAPLENLQVETTGNTAMSIISSSLSTLYFGTSSNHVLGAIRYDSQNASMNFWTNNTPNRIAINNAGNVGIGTANPGLNPGATKYLTISSTTQYANSPAAIEMEGAYMGTNVPFARLDFNSWGLSTVASTNVARVAGYNGGTVGMGVLGFSTRNGSTMIERMRIDEAGKVSIGNFANTASLQIVDGSQGAGKVLTSDAQGNASWMDVLPAGMVMAYAGSVIPTGWLVCNGSLQPKASYPNLWAALGNSWGGSSGTHFYLPNMQGMFLRGVNNGTGVDPDAITRSAQVSGGSTGDKVGSVQQDQLESHTHGVGSTTTLLGGVITVGAATGGSNPISSTGGQETRPKNVYVYYIIKY